MNFLEEKNISGHLQIVKVYKSGEEETLLDDSNIIVSGMGAGLSYLFAENAGTGALINNFQIGKFQVGVSGPPAGGVVSSINELSGPLSSVDEYGLGSNLVLETNELWAVPGTALIGNQIIARIPGSKVTRIGDSSVRFTLVLDEEACNGLTRGSSDAAINEVGLLMNNPLNSPSERPVLVAYRTFSDIYKTSDFSLIFRWTINF